MAKGNLLLGQGAGKLGDVVLYRNAGQQQARAYVSNPKNPKTYKQAKQRAKFASVALAYQYFKTIIDRSTRYRDGRTAYNEFLKNNISGAPFASKSERQEWAGLFALPSTWTAAFGTLARPQIWTPTYSNGIEGGADGLYFCSTPDFLNHILNYFLSVGWIPQKASPNTRFNPTADQIAEALAGTPNTHLCIAAGRGQQAPETGEIVNGYGVQVVEYIGDLADQIRQGIVFKTNSNGDWYAEIEVSIGVRAPWGSLTIAAGTSDSEGAPNDVRVHLGTLGIGFQYAVWIGSNSGSAVQVSNIIFEVGGSQLKTVEQYRKDESEVITAAAIASWQTEDAAGTDTTIY